MWPLGLLLTCRPWRRAPEWRVRSEPLSWLSLSTHSFLAGLQGNSGQRPGGGKPTRHKDCTGIQHFKKSPFPAALRGGVAATWLYSLSQAHCASLFPPFISEARIKLSIGNKSHQTDLGTSLHSVLHFLEDPRSLAKQSLCVWRDAAYPCKDSTIA